MISIHVPDGLVAARLESPLIYNELHERLHSQFLQSSIGTARIGTFVAVVVETPEHMERRTGARSSSKNTIGVGAVMRLSHCHLALFVTQSFPRWALMMVRDTGRSHPPFAKLESPRVPVD